MMSNEISEITSLPKLRVDEPSFDEYVFKKKVVLPIVLRIGDALKSGDTITRDVNLYRLVHVFREAVSRLPERKDAIVKMIFEGFRETTGEDECLAIGSYQSGTQSLYAQFTYANDKLMHHEPISFLSSRPKDEPRLAEAGDLLTVKIAQRISLLRHCRAILPTEPENGENLQRKEEIEKN